MANAFCPTAAFNAYRGTGLSAFEAHVGRQFDRDAFEASRVLTYGLGLQTDRNEDFRVAVVAAGTAWLAREEAQAADVAGFSSKKLGADLTAALIAMREDGRQPTDHQFRLIADAAQRLAR